MLIAFLGFSIHRDPWDSSCGYESSASDAWLIYAARTQHGELLRPDRPQSNNQHRKNPQHRSDHSH
jgi:hypothetical protein